MHTDIMPCMHALSFKPVLHWPDNATPSPTAKELPFYGDVATCSRLTIDHLAAHRHHAMNACTCFLTCSPLTLLYNNISYCKRPMLPFKRGMFIIGTSWNRLSIDRLAARGHYAMQACTIFLTCSALARLCNIITYC